MPQVSLVAAFMAGFLSFLSPCILPLIPAYISFIVGVSADDLRNRGEGNRRIFKTGINCLLFVAGFSAVFIIMGASATAFGSFILEKKRILGQIGGAIVILFGLHLTRIWRIKALDYEKRFQLKDKPAGAIGSLLVGMAFALGWTPCIGPILASILAYAATQQTTRYGMLLLGSYSLGLGIPFILTGLSINSFFLWFDKIKRHLALVERISGILLILVGVLMLTNNFQQLANLLVPAPGDYQSSQNSGPPLASSDHSSLKAPRFMLKDLAGARVSSQKFVGKITILNFWTTWCKFCRVEIPHLNEIYKNYKKRGVEVIGISFDYGGAKDVIPFIKKVPIDYPILIGNPNLGNSFGGIVGFPTTIIIDRNWRIYKRYPGLISKGALEQDINQLLARD